MITALLLAAVVIQDRSATLSQLPAQQVPVVAEQTAPKEPWPPAGVTRIGKGIISPEVIKDRKALYTDAARNAGIQGMVELEAVVLTDGTVGEVRVVRSLDKTFGLDEAAVAAMKQWLFKPGKKDGVAVPVLVAVEMTFTLRK
jgi:TonB family protein